MVLVTGWYLKQAATALFTTHSEFSSMSKAPFASPLPALLAKSVTPCCSASPLAKCWAKTSPLSCNCWKFLTKKPRTPLKGVIMELEDCAFPLLAGIEAHADPMTAFKDTDYALLVGARPRGPGMERVDLLAANAQIFTAQGKALNAVAQPQRQSAGGRQPRQHQRLHRHEVGSRPAGQKLHRHAAPGPQPRRFATGCQNRHRKWATSRKLTVWGNHSPTMYADYRFATVNGESGQRQ